MDFRRWLRITGSVLCVVGGVVSVVVIPEVPGVGIRLVTLGAGGLLSEYSIYGEEQRFEHEKSLREMDEKSRQLQYERDIEWLRELEDFYSVKPDA
jgi:hypothetical protein